MEANNTAPTTRQSPKPPRTRALLEFIEGGITRPPVVYPDAGSAELDEALREEILKRWARG